MNKIARLILIFSAIVLSAACTQLPFDRSGSSARPAISEFMAKGDDNVLLSLISDARIGASLTHIDQVTGLASTVRVTSEYFSANGRSCRRFSQHFSNSATLERKLACKGRNGWQEIPVASIVE